MGEICRRHGVTVVSDEIHCELEMPGYNYTPFAACSQENLNSCVSFNSPSKSFNLAGIQVSNIVTSDPVLREKIATVMHRFEHGHLNSFAVDALIAAYSEEGEEWLRQLNAYLHDNFRAMEARLSQELPDMKLCRLEGTDRMIAGIKRIQRKSGKAE